MTDKDRLNIIILLILIGYFVLLADIDIYQAQCIKPNSILIRWGK